jgi:hypothetical protein
LIAAYRAVAVLTVLGVGVQFFLAGAGAFGATDYHSHRVLGVALAVIGALGLGLALALRRSPVRALALEVAILVQILLGHLGTHHPWVGAVHGAFAIVVAALASVIARRLGVRRSDAPRNFASGSRCDGSLQRSKRVRL